MIQDNGPIGQVEERHGVIDTRQPAGEKITNLAVRSVKWSALAETSSQVIPPIVTLVLARILSPSDFGVIGIAVAVISFVHMFWEAGFAKALVQTPDDPEVAASVAFWTNVLLGVLIYALLFSVAPLLSNIFHDGRVTLVLRVLGLQVIVLSLGSVQAALSRRAFNFKVVFWARLAASLLPGVVSIPLALHGYGHWALVGGTLMGTVANVVVLWSLNSWRPKRVYDFSVALKLGKFSWWVALEGSLSWFYVWADAMILGAYLGTKSFGLYQTGSSIVQVVFAVILTPLMPVFYSSFCRLQGNSAELKQMFFRATRLTITLALPAAGGLFVLGNPMSELLFGDKWMGLGAVISMLALVQGWMWFVGGVNAELFRSMGRPDVLPKLMVVELLFFIPAYVWAAPLGLETFLWARLLVGLISLPLQVWIVVRLVHLPPSFLWNQSKVAWLAVGTMTLLVFMALSLVGESLGGPVERGLILVALVALGALAYLAVLTILDRPFVRELAGLVRQAVVG